MEFADHGNDRGSLGAQRQRRRSTAASIERRAHELSRVGTARGPARRRLPARALRFPRPTALAGPAPPTLDGHADDLVRLLDALQIESAHVAGVSFGALVGITLAARASSRVRSLTAMNATDRVTPEMAARGAPAREAAHVAATGGDAGRLLDLVAETTWSPEYRAAQASALAARRQGVGLLPRTWFVGLGQLLAALDNLDMTPLLPRIACPTLIVGGEADVTFPVEHSRALAAGIPGSRLVVIPKGSHGVVIERAAEVIDLVVDFIQDVEARATRL